MKNASSRLRPKLVHEEYRRCKFAVQQSPVFERETYSVETRSLRMPNDVPLSKNESQEAKTDVELVFYPYESVLLVRCQHRWHLGEDTRGRTMRVPEPFPWAPSYSTKKAYYEKPGSELLQAARIHMK